MFAFLVIAWGGSFAAIKAGLAYFPPVLFVSVRFVLAGGLLFAYVLVRRETWRPRTRDDYAAVAVAGVLVAGANNVLLFLGQQTTPSAVAGITFGLIPVLTAALAWPLLPEERLTRAGAVGVAFGLAGAALVVRPDPANLLGTDVVGRLLVLAAAAVAALGTVLLRRSSPGLSSAAVTAWAMLVGAVGAGGFGLLIGETPSGMTWTLRSAAVLALLVVVSTAGAYTVYYALISRIGPVQTSMSAYLEPVVATLLGWAAFDEPITAATLGGFALVVVGFSLLKRRALARLLSSRRVRGE
jgi:drug/metabolite transporter (DMT)-like permease